jgi:hypothetical protein
MLVETSSKEGKSVVLLDCKTDDPAYSSVSTVVRVSEELISLVSE